MPSPIENIAQFIDCFDDQSDIKSYIQLALDSVWSSPDVESWTTNRRSDFVLFFRQAEKVLEALRVVAPPIIAIYKISKQSNNEKDGSF
jgi:hypothetical protein